MLAKYVKVAGNKCPSLMRKRVSPHVLRHTTAMELLQGGVDKTLIALWLGHESTETTQIYLAYLSQFEGFTTAKCFSFSGG
jgi:site-specific recombinase XerD